MRKLGRFMVVTTIAFSGTRALQAILMLSFSVADSDKYFCMLGRELGFLVLCCVVLFGKRKVLEFVTSVVPIVLASAIYFMFILLLKSYVADRSWMISRPRSYQWPWDYCQSLLSK